MNRRTLNIVIAMATAAAALVAIRWADREFRRVESPAGAPRLVNRPDWVAALYRPYRRLQNDALWAGVAVTVGLGIIVACDPVARRRPGGIVVLIALTACALTTAHYLLAAPAIFRTNGDCYGLRNALEFRVPGAILGAWAVVWGRRVDWRGRLVVGIWMIPVAMLVAFGLVFG